MKAVCIAILLVLPGALWAQTGEPSITGPFIPGMDQVDSTVLGLMTKYSCPGAQLAITYNGRLVLARGYGLADVASGSVVQPDSRMRVASLSKFVTAIAVMTLVQQSRINLDASAFALIPQLAPLPGATVDPRLKTITVRQLLQHTGGWDASVSGDPMFNSDTISAAAGTTPPASADTIIRYMLGQPLDFDPGTQFAYSNFGYCVLGRIIESVTGQAYGDYVQSAVFAPAGITRAVLGHSLAADRAAGEVTYYDYPGAPLVGSVFPPTDALVPGPYGGFSLEAVDSAGGWVMNTIDYVRLWAAIDGTKPPALLSSPSLATLLARPAPPVSVNAPEFYAMGLEVDPVDGDTLAGAIISHNGSLAGTSTYEFHLFTGWTVALFFNTRPLAVDSLDTDVENTIETQIAGLAPPAAGDLFLNAPLSITSQPAAQTVATGSTVVFNISTSGAAGQTYQWFLGTTSIAGANSSVLVVPSATAADAGNYTCVITDSFGSVVSLAAPLNVVTTSNPGRLVNLSCRAQVGTGGDILIAGFAVGGQGTTGSEPLLIRGSGPALIPFGVPGTLPDPQLQLFAGDTVLGTNDGWGGSSAIKNAAASVGAFAWSQATSHDSALLANLATGPYTAQIAGQDGDSGVALVEVYDETPIGTYALTSPRLVNISSRVRVGSGAETLIAGFVIGGSTSRTVLIRASGPALESFGVSGTLPDPQLALYSGNIELANNSGWGGNTQIAATAAAVGAFSWSVSSNDSAILVTLPPGAYTVQVSGASGDSGVALVEVYDVP